MVTFFENIPNSIRQIVISYAFFLLLSQKRPNSEPDLENRLPYFYEAKGHRNNQRGHVWKKKESATL